MNLQDAFVELHNALSAAAATVVESKPDLFICDADLDETRCFLLGSGWETALDRLRQAVALRQSPPAIIVMGSQADIPGLQVGRKRASTAQRLAVWEGLAYLQYGFTKQHFIDAARQAIAGKGSPLPTLEPHSDELRKRAFAVRHWLQNKRKNIDAAAADFVAAAGGSFMLSEAHLAETKASTPKHDRMLAPFIDARHSETLDAEAKEAIANFASMIEQFKTDWEGVECLRRQVREVIGTGQTAQIQTTSLLLAECIQQASATVVLGISQLDTLLERLNESSGT